MFTYNPFRSTVPLQEHKIHVVRTLHAVLFALFVLLVDRSWAQPAPPPEVKYLRPAVTTVLVSSTDPKAKVVINAFKDLPMIAKFDDHGVGLPEIALPEMPNVADDLGMASIKARIFQDSVRRAALNMALVPVARNGVAKWFNRDATGAMDLEYITQRGSYSATDQDVNDQKAAQNNRTADIGFDLLNKTYIIIYSIDEILTMEQVYDQRDAKAMAAYIADKKAAEAAKQQFTKEPPKPVERKQEGYELRYLSYLYKINWTDSVANAFAQNLWMDKSTGEAGSRKLLFNKTTFPLKYVESTSGSAESTQPKDAASSYYTLLGNKRLSMEELLELFPEKIQESATSSYSLTVDDFKTKAPIHTDWPITAKLGSKEGLEEQDRFLAYEFEQDDEGKPVKKRVGVVRVREVADNDTIATGESAASTFRQQGGKKLYTGTLLEEQHDMGLNFSIGWNQADRLTSGVGISLKSNIPGVVLNIHDLYLGVFVTGGVGANTDASGLVFPNYFEQLTKEGSTQYTFTGKDGARMEPGLWRSFSWTAGLTISKEIYIGRRGNLYLEPTIGYSITSFNFIANDDVVFGDETFSEFTRTDEDGNAETFTDVQVMGAEWKWEDDAKNTLSYSSSFITAGCGVGIHLGASLALELRPMFMMRSAYTYGGESAFGDAVFSDSGITWTDYVTRAQLNEARGGSAPELSDKAEALANGMDKTNRLSIFAGLKFRF
jgi:hypothetical protein